MRITKAMLEAENLQLHKECNALRNKIFMLEEQLTFFRTYSTGSHASTLVIAAEKTTEALAHIITDLKEIKRMK